MTAETMLYPLVFILLLVPIVTAGWTLVFLLRFVFGRLTRPD